MACCYLEPTWRTDVGVNAAVIHILQACRTMVMSLGPGGHGMNMKLHVIVKWKNQAGVKHQARLWSAAADVERQ